MSIYPTTIGNTKSFASDSVKLIGINGVSTGIGSIISGLSFLLLNKFIQNNRSRVYFFGFCLNLLSFLLIFLNHPSNSTFEETHGFTYIEPK